MNYLIIQKNKDSVSERILVSAFFQKPIYFLKTNKLPAGHKVSQICLYHYDFVTLKSI